MSLRIGKRDTKTSPRRLRAALLALLRVPPQARVIERGRGRECVRCCPRRRRPWLMRGPAGGADPAGGVAHCHGRRPERRREEEAARRRGRRPEKLGARAPPLREGDGGRRRWGGRREAAAGHLGRSRSCWGKKRGEREREEGAGGLKK